MRVAGVINRGIVTRIQCQPHVIRAWSFTPCSTYDRIVRDDTISVHGNPTFVSICLEEVFAGSHNTLLFRERKREDSRMAKLEKFLLLKTNHRSRSHWDHRRHDEGYRRGGGGEGL